MGVASRAGSHFKFSTRRPVQGQSGEFQVSLGYRVTLVFFFFSCLETKLKQGGMYKLRRGTPGVLKLSADSEAFSFNI